MVKFILILFFIVTYSFSNQLFSPLPKNTIYDRQKVQLGKKLFFDPILSKNNDISCFSCHSHYGTDNLPVSIGTDGLKGTRNSISIFNAPFKLAFFWDGRSNTLKEQMTDGPLFNAHEMANDKQTILTRINNSKEYVALIKQIYNSKPTFEILLDALVSFQKTLITSNSKFDKYLRGGIQLDPIEKKGLDLFIGYGCVSCHNGINIGSNSYQEFGSIISVNENNSSSTQTLKFLVPSLRNVEKTYPYFHDGSISSLKEAIEKMAFHNIGIELKEEEIFAIESFLKTLTGELPKTLRDEK